LNYAESQHEEQRLQDFILSELEDVEFTNETFKTLYNTFREGAERGDVIDAYYFMEHGTSEVKQAVAELITPRYETSKHWSDKYHIYFPHEK
jgi:DNA primase